MDYHIVYNLMPYHIAYMYMSVLKKKKKILKFTYSPEIIVRVSSLDGIAEGIWLW
jgi:hypothetical protein